MVWAPTEYHLEIIHYDQEFWEDMEEVLEHFYTNCLLPEIVDPRAPRGLPVREPEYFLQVGLFQAMIRWSIVFFRLKILKT